MNPEVSSGNPEISSPTRRLPQCMLSGGSRNLLQLASPVGTCVHFLEVKWDV